MRKIFNLIRFQTSYSAYLSFIMTGIGNTDFWDHDINPENNHFDPSTIEKSEDLSWDTDEAEELDFSDGSEDLNSDGVESLKDFCESRASVDCDSDGVGQLLGLSDVRRNWDVDSNEFEDNVMDYSDGSDYDSTGDYTLFSKPRKYPKNVNKPFRSSEILEASSSFEQSSDSQQPVTLASTETPLQPLSLTERVKNNGKHIDPFKPSHFLPDNSDSISSGLRQFPTNTFLPIDSNAGLPTTQGTKDISTLSTHININCTSTSSDHSLTASMSWQGHHTPLFVSQAKVETPIQQQAEMVPAITNELVDPNKGLYQMQIRKQPDTISKLVYLNQFTSTGNPPMTFAESGRSHNFPQSVTPVHSKTHMQYQPILVTADSKTTQTAPFPVAQPGTSQQIAQVPKQSTSNNNIPVPINPNVDQYQVKNACSLSQLLHQPSLMEPKDNKSTSITINFNKPSNSIGGPLATSLSGQSSISPQLSTPIHTEFLEHQPFMKLPQNRDMAIKHTKSTHFPGNQSALHQSHIQIHSPTTNSNQPVSPSSRLSQNQLNYMENNSERDGKQPETVVELHFDQSSTSNGVCLANFKSGHSHQLTSLAHVESHQSRLASTEDKDRPIPMKLTHSTHFLPDQQAPAHNPLAQNQLTTINCEPLHHNVGLNQTQSTCNWFQLYLLEGVEPKGSATISKSINLALPAATFFSMQNHQSPQPGKLAHNETQRPIQNQHLLVSEEKHILMKPVHSMYFPAAQQAFTQIPSDQKQPEKFNVKPIQNNLGQSHIQHNKQDDSKSNVINLNQAFTSSRFPLMTSISGQDDRLTKPVNTEPCITSTQHQPPLLAFTEDKNSLVQQILPTEFPSSQLQITQIPSDQEQSITYKDPSLESRRSLSQIKQKIPPETVMKCINLNQPSSSTVIPLASSISGQNHYSLLSSSAARLEYEPVMASTANNANLTELTLQDHLQDPIQQQLLAGFTEDEDILMESTHTEHVPEVDSDITLYPLVATQSASNLINHQSIDNIGGVSPAQNAPNWFRLLNLPEEPKDIRREFTVRPTGPKNIPKGTITPSNFFSLFFTPEIWTKLVNATNRYAHTLMKNRKKKDLLGPCKTLPKWRNVTVSEMKKFWAIIINMGLTKRNSLQEYWSRRRALYTSFFAQTMTIRRFKAILTMFYTSNKVALLPNRSRHDSLAMIQGFVDSMNASFINYFTPNQDICINESMVGIKDRCVFIQCTPKKRNSPFGIKKFDLCDSKTGYVMQSVMFSAKEFYAANGEAFIQKVVRPLLEDCDLLNKKYHLLTDDYHTQLPLAQWLHNNGCYFTGTINKRMKDIPKTFSDMNPGVGETIYFRKRDEPALLVKFRGWVTKNPVDIMTTACHAENVEIKTRRGDSQLKPVVIHRYDQYIADVNSKMNNIFQAVWAPPTEQYWRQIIYNLFDMAIFNSYTLYSLCTKRPLSRYNFMCCIVEDLTPPPIIPPQRPLNFSTAIGQGESRGHTIAPLPKGLTRVCIVCKPHGVTSKSAFWCPDCNIGVHQSCFDFLQHFLREPNRGGQCPNRQQFEVLVSSED